MSETTLDPERQREAKTYARIRQRLILVDVGIGGIYALAWLVLGWWKELKTTLLGFTSNDWLLVAGFGIVFGGIYYLINLPLSFYAGYTLPHRFKQSNQTVKDWISDQIKGLLIGFILGGVILEIIYTVLRAAPDTWWLWVAFIMLLFNVLLANLAPVLIFPIFYKFVPLEDEYTELAERLKSLAELAGARVRGVFKFDMSRRTKAANAALTGLGNTRRIILGDTLLDEFTSDEIETVLAHELGHHVHKDIPKGILIESVITLVGLYLASLGLLWGTTVFGFEGPADIAALPLFVLVMGAYGFLTMPLTNAYSRARERRADEYALKATDNGSAYASALIRLANQNLADADPEPWVEILLYSHPALSKRIEMARNYASPN